MSLINPHLSTFTTINFFRFDDTRGSLIALESQKNVPFEIKRIYSLFGADADTKRGQHAHKNLRQVIFSLKGSCQLYLETAQSKHTFTLNKCDQGILIEPYTWRELFNFTNDCIVLVLANAYYDPQDYIHDYQEFQRLCVCSG